MKAFTQGAVFVRVAQLAQQAANVVRPLPGFFDEPEGGGERDSAGLRLLEHLALERTALPRSLRIQAAGTILTQGRTGLGKASDGRLAA